MPEQDDFMRALAAFQEPTFAAESASTTVDVCGEYKKVKPILQGILPFLSLIPKIGKPAAAAIKSLMAGVDTFCGTGAVTASAAFAGQPRVPTPTRNFFALSPCSTQPYRLLRPH